MYCESECAIYCSYSDNFFSRLIQRQYSDEQFLHPDQPDQLHQICPMECPYNNNSRNQAVAYALIYCRKHHQLREEYLWKEGDTTKEIRKPFSVPVLARRAAIFMAKTGLQSELERSCFVDSGGFHTE